MTDNVTLQSILRTMDAAGKIPSVLSDKAAKTIFDIMTCHTLLKGVSVSVCPRCQARTLHYGSCNNPNCPECGWVKSEEWVEAQRDKLINAPACHIIFTLPDQFLNELILSDRERIYNMILKAQAEALKEISREPGFFGADKTGFTSCLHTWGSSLIYHVHVHTLFFCAGLDKEGQLVKTSEKFVFPAKKLAGFFKAKLLKQLCRRYEYTGSPWLIDLYKAKKTKWNVEIRPVLNSAESIIRYFSRYVQRTAISNSRLLAYDGEYVSFRYKDYRDHGKMKVMKLKDTEFLRRFIQYIPPERFSRVRHYGFLSNNSRKELKHIKELTKTPEHVHRTKEEIMKELLGEKLLCRKCAAETVTVRSRSPYPMSARGLRHVRGNMRFTTLISKLDQSRPDRHRSVEPSMDMIRRQRE